MRFTHLIISIIVLFSTKVLVAQTEPTIATCDGQQSICLTENSYDLCVKITVRDGLEAPIDHFMIDWGDGQSTRVEGSNSPDDQDHTYDFNGLFNTCTASDRRTVILETFLENGTILNNAFVLTARNPPIADFNFSESTICTGDEAVFNSNSCPTEGLEIISWNYGNGDSGMDNRQIYESAGEYPVTLRVRNSCGEAQITKTLTVLNPPIALAQPISGTIEGNGTDEPYLVCLGDGGQVILDGSQSENANEFEWSASGSGFQWVSDQRNRIDTIQFLAAGNYDITLTVNNACDKESICVHRFRVVDAAGLVLNQQTDGCNQLEYTPNPFNLEATYTINGETVSDFPTILNIGTYEVEATLSNECGNLMLRDDFVVAAEQQVNILNQDTTLCSDALAFDILLSDTAAIGNCLVNGTITTDCQFDHSSFAGRESILSFEGACATSNEVRIEVIDAGGLSINLPNTTFCVDDPPFEIPVSDEGGEFTGRGFGDSSATYSPALAGVGFDTIRYELEFAAGISEVCPAGDTKVIQIFPPLQVDFELLSCNGNTVQFDTINTSITYTSIEYDFGDGQTSNQENPSHTYNRAGDYIVTVSLMQDGGCVATRVQDITVEPPPTAVFSLDFDPDTCSVLEVTIDNQSSGNILEYSWDFGNGQTDSTANPNNIFYDAIGRDTTYFLSLSVRNGCSTQTETKEIKVKAGPNPGFVLDKDLHCSGEQVSFQSVVANADSNNDFWFWDYGNGNTSTGMMPDSQFYETMRQDTFFTSLTVGNVCDTMTTTLPIVVVPSDVDAFLNIDKTIGCGDQGFRFINASGVPNAEFFFPDGTTFQGDTISKMFPTLVDTMLQVRMRVFGCGYDDTTMLFRVLPSPELELLADNRSCSGDELIVEVNSNVAGIVVDFGDGFEVEDRLATHVYDSVGMFIIRAIASSPRGCRTELTQPITILQRPTANLQIINDLICERNTVTFQDNSLGDISNWRWQFGDGNLSTGTESVTHLYEMVDEYTIQLIVDDENTCSDTLNRNIVVQALPQLNLSASMPDLCLAQIQFTNSTVADGFIWQFGDGSPNSELTNPLHTYGNSGDYEVRLIANLEGCLDSTTLELNIPEFPEMNVSINQDMFCAPSSVQFDATRSSNVDDYFWDFGDGTNSFNASQIHTFVAPGTYQTQLSITKGACTIDSLFQIMVGDTLLANISAVTNVACFGEQTGSAMIEVTSGNAPYSFLWSNQLNTNPASDLAAGSYEVTITDELGCTQFLSTAITQPATPITTSVLSSLNTSCYEASDGFLEIAASGGTPPYQYLWEDGRAVRVRENLIAGVYPVTITDGNDCLFEDSFEITQPAPLVVDFLAPPICADTVGSITVSPSGGTAPYLIGSQPTFEQLGDFYPNLSKGVYQFFVQDVNGCETNASVELEELPDWQFSIAPAQVNILKGDSIFVRPFISIDDAIFEWQPSSTVRTPLEKDTWMRPLATTIYSLKATDEFGCVKTAGFTAFVKDTVAVYIPNAFTPFSGDGSRYNNYFTAYSNFPAAEYIKEMTITNRYHEIVFYESNLPLNEEQKGWNGTLNGIPLPADDYAYRMVIKYVDGEEVFVGKVILIR